MVILLIAWFSNHIIHTVYCESKNFDDFVKVYFSFLSCEDSTADCLKLLLDIILGTWCDSY